MIMYFVHNISLTQYFKREFKRWQFYRWKCPKWTTEILWKSLLSCISLLWLSFSFFNHWVQFLGLKEIHRISWTQKTKFFEDYFKYKHHWSAYNKDYRFNAWNYFLSHYDSCEIKSWKLLESRIRLVKQETCW